MKTGVKRFCHKRFLSQTFLVTNDPCHKRSLSQTPFILLFLEILIKVDCNMPAFSVFNSKTVQCSINIDYDALLIACSVGPVKSPKRDVAFLIDSSASLREGNFMAQKNIVKQIIGDIYPVSVDGNRICVARYSDDAKIEVNLNEYFTNEALYRSIDSIPYTGGGSRFDKALKTASAQLFSVANGARSDAQKVRFLYDFL